MSTNKKELTRFESRYGWKAIVVLIAFSFLYTSAWVWFMLYPYTNIERPTTWLRLLGAMVVILDIIIVYVIVKMKRGTNENK